MNTLVSLTQYPVVAILLQWTVLLALCWLAHGLLRKRHARWRLIVWRSALCFAIVLPLSQVFPVPVVEVPVETARLPAERGSEEIHHAQSSPGISAPATATQDQVGPKDGRATMGTAQPLEVRASSDPISWGTLLFGVWALGVAAGAIRLLRLHVQLSRIKYGAVSASFDVQSLAQRIKTGMGIRWPLEIRLCTSIHSPFVCGVATPTVLLPRTLFESLPPKQASALLAHEIAHIRQQDVFWCVAWRWMQTVCWFHPLVWKIPSAHNLACEQEADRLASSQLNDHKVYRQTLAQLALRLICPPSVETRLTANGTSQIVRRLNHLAKEGIGVWRWKHTLAAFSLMGLFLIVTVGFQFSSAAEPESADELMPERARVFEDLRVVVLDDADDPVAGATVQPTGLRVHSEGPNRASWYGWNPEVHGPLPEVRTDADGIATFQYPVEMDPQEKWRTRIVTISVDHPDFAMKSAELAVDGDPEPVVLTRGVQMEASGYFGEDRQPVMDIVPNLSRSGSRAENWVEKEVGVMATSRLAPGAHLIQLTGRLPSGEIVFSELREFTARQGEEKSLSLEMQPGIRLEGRLDENVPRPVEDGRVLIRVRSDGLPPLDNQRLVLPDEFGSFRPWGSYREIAEDGSFVFESVPPGEVDVIVHGEGFVSSDGGDFMTIENGMRVPHPGFRVPQTFELTSPVTNIEVATEPAASLAVTARTNDGEPIEGATVYASPNVLRFGIFGRTRSLTDEEPFRELPELPEVSYSAVTDEEGVAILRNLPAHRVNVTIDHPQFVAPLDGDYRTTHILVSPGEKKTLDLTLQPKGKDFAGEQ